jgi:putative DNA primase/helicase
MTRKLRKAANAPIAKAVTPVSMLEQARRFKRQRHPSLIWFQQEWLLWRGSHYEAVEPDLIRRDAYQFLDDASLPATMRMASELVDALKSVALVERGTFSPPCWLNEERPAYKASEMLAFRNGLLHLPTGRLLKPTPDFFTLNSLPYGYDSKAREPKTWLTFLSDLWNDDPEQIILLQEVMGYLLTPDTSQQKLFLLIGAKRGGKGTILRVIEGLIGSANICSPTLPHLGTRFGLQTTVGKTLATIADMRLPSNRHADKQGLVGNLLRITGEDAVDIEQKYKDVFTARLPLRILIATNKPPHLPDTSGAFAARVVALRFTKSFAGREDTGLSRKLEMELPGILLWAITGWKRLHQRGKFIETVASREVAQKVNELASPLHAFLRERCVLDPEEITPKADVWQCFKEFMQERELTLLPPNQSDFDTELEEATTFWLKEVRPSAAAGKSRPRCWQGLRLRDAARDDPDS